MPCSSTGRGGKLLVRPHSASGSRKRPFGKMSITWMKMMLVLAWGWATKQKSTCRRMVAIIVQLSRLVAWVMLPRIQAGWADL